MNVRSTIFKVLVLPILALGPACNLWSQGYIVPNGVVYRGSTGLGYRIDVTHNPTNGARTGFFLEPQGVTPPSFYVNTFLFDPLLDVSVRVFQVSANDPVSLQPILDGAYTELRVPNAYVFNSGVPFYLGLYTGNMIYPPPDGIYDDPLFGWVELVNNRGAIEMIDGALEYKGGGILAGTRTVLGVPEPAAGVLCALGILLLVLRFGPPKGAQQSRVLR